MFQPMLVEQENSVQKFIMIDMVLGVHDPMVTLVRVGVPGEPSNGKIMHLSLSFIKVLRPADAADWPG